ncbi:MAG TPA: sigma-54 dependent transcriptional regulator [Usitatibacter sp.]|nr:sigma-54 dependent transcriptional regulator [Usitatibacter sp.]
MAIAPSPEAPERIAARPVVLVVEDDEAMRTMLVEVLDSLDAEVMAARDGAQACDLLERHDVCVVLTDLRMPRADGLRVMRYARERNPAAEVVLITGHGTVESAVEALKGGAYDYLRKPFEPEALRRTVDRALQFALLNRENQRLREMGRAQVDDNGLIGRTAPMEAARRLVEVFAGYDCPVLITGESGTGKEIASRLIHVHSRRRDKSFVAINCAAIPENLIESELFGYQAGAFTGAGRAKPGLFEVADGGTMYLDEINNAPPSLQVKLLRVLQDGTFFRMGGIEPRRVDVRLLAAANRPLPELVEAGEFRADLYYRLKVGEIHLPPLRERKADVPILASFFLAKHAGRLGKPVRGLSTQALSALVRHDWPGNGRELENVIQRMIILARGDTLELDSVPPDLLERPEARQWPLDHFSPQTLDEVEAHFIAKTLRENNGNRAATAQVLGIDKSTLWRKIKRHNLA